MILQLFSGGQYRGTILEVSRFLIPSCYKITRVYETVNRWHGNEQFKTNKWISTLNILITAYSLSY